MKLRCCLLLILLLFCLIFSSHGANNCKDLLDAARSVHGDLEKLKLSITTDNINTCRHKAFAGGTALLIAASNGHVATIETLIKFGADVNLKNNVGSTALIIASANGKHSAVEVLLKSGAHVNITTTELGNSALMKAVVNGHAKVVDLLLKAGADVNSRNKAGETALYYAAKSNSAISDALIRAGADASLTHKTSAASSFKYYAEFEDNFNNSSRGTSGLSGAPATCFQWSQNKVFRRVNVSVNQSHSYPISPAIGVPAGLGGRHGPIDNTTKIPPSNASKQVWVYPASEGQDKLVMTLLGHKTNGYFVDLAARYWFKGSNSWALEYYLNWSGVCIEPDGNFYPGLAINRTCAVICNNPVSSESGKSVHFHYSINNFKKNDGNEYGVKYTVTLMDILDFVQAPPVIDYFSLDVEGYEGAILKSLDFKKYTFLVMTVERPSNEDHTRLVDAGYWWVKVIMPEGSKSSFGECLYIHESIPNFEQHMNYFRGIRSFDNSTAWNRGVHHTWLLKPSWPWGNETAMLAKKKQEELKQEELKQEELKQEELTLFKALEVDQSSAKQEADTSIVSNSEGEDSSFVSKKVLIFVLGVLCLVAIIAVSILRYNLLPDYCSRWVRKNPEDRL